MNLNETINELFQDKSVVEVVVARAPNANLFVQAKQLVETTTGRMNLIHQAEGDSFVECLEGVKKQIDHANKIKTSVVRLPGNGR